MTYKAKVDWWAWLLRLFVFAGGVDTVLEEFSWIHLAFWGTILLLLGMRMPARFETDDYVLNVRYGLSTDTIPWASVNLIGPPPLLAFGHAMSRKRVQIRYRGGRTIVAPREMDRFLEDVSRHCPHLQRHGAELTRSDG